MPGTVSELTIFCQQDLGENFKKKTSILAQNCAEDDMIFSIN